MRNELLELTARYTRHCLYKWQHRMGDFSGTAECCNLWDLTQAALGEASAHPQVTLGRVLSAVCTSMGYRFKLAQLYPCPLCPTWTVDEWWLDGDTIVKAHRVMEVIEIQTAVQHYRIQLGTLKQAIYDATTDSYSCRDDDCNFIVTGSHGRCSACLEKYP